MSWVPGTTCAWSLGQNWIDGGTQTRWQSRPPGPSGVYYSTAANAQPAIAVLNFSGSGPESEVLGTGLPAILMTDLSNDPRLTVVEWLRRAELMQEIEFSNSPYADPTTRIPRGHWIQPDTFLRGHITTTEEQVSWDLELISSHTGEVIGVVKGSVKAEKFLDSTDSIGKQVAVVLLDWWHKTHRHRHRHRHKRRILKKHLQKKAAPRSKDLPVPSSKDRPVS